MTFCQILEVASRVRQKVFDHRSLTTEKCSVQEKIVVGDKRSLMAGSLMTGSTVAGLLYFIVLGQSRQTCQLELLVKCQ